LQTEERRFGVHVEHSIPIIGLGSTVSRRPHRLQRS
jgi:hypothetical protein